MAGLLKTLRILKSHLSTHLARNPDANFKSWIASLHPENVTLDPRLDNANPEENEWLAIWAEAVSGRDTDAEVGGDEPATLTDAEAQTTSARQAQPLRGWGGLVDISLGVGLSLAAGGLAGGTELFYACVLWTARGAYAAYQSAAAMDGVLRIFAAIPGLVALVCWHSHRPLVIQLEFSYGSGGLEGCSGHSLWELCCVKAS